MRVRYYPTFTHPIHGSVGDFLCEACAGERKISEEQHAVTKCDRCGKEEDPISWEEVLHGVMFAIHNMKESK